MWYFFFVIDLVSVSFFNNLYSPIEAGVELRFEERQNAEQVQRELDERAGERDYENVEEVVEQNFKSWKTLLSLPTGRFTMPRVISLTRFTNPVKIRIRA